jgi:hypothetical protein
VVIFSTKAAWIAGETFYKKNFFPKTTLVSSVVLVSSLFSSVVLIFSLFSSVGPDYSVIFS